MEIPNNTNSQETPNAEEILKSLGNFSEDKVNASAKLKSDLVVKEAKDLLLKHNIIGETLNEEDVELVIDLALFSLNEIIKSFPLDNPTTDNTPQSAFMQSITSFWKKVISNIKTWTPE